MTFIITLCPFLYNNIVLYIIVTETSLIRPNHGKLDLSKVDMTNIWHLEINSGHGIHTPHVDYRKATDSLEEGFRNDLFFF